MRKKPLFFSAGKQDFFYPYIRNFLLCLCVLCLTSGCQKTVQNDIELLMQRIVAYSMQNPDSKTIRQYMDSMQEDGSWQDVDYTHRGRNAWLPCGHYLKLYDMAFAYINPENALFADPTLYEKIVRGLEYWYDRNPDSDNWWHNQIHEPLKLGVILIAMRQGKQQIPAELEAKTVERIRTDCSDPAEWTGANRSHIATHWVYRALLTADVELLKQSIAYIFEPLHLFNKDEEGLQVDFSFFQHKLQFYADGYGEAMIFSMIEWGNYIKGTQFELTEEQRNLLHDFFLKGYMPTMRGNYKSYHTMGRYHTRPNVTRRDGSVRHICTELTELDPAHTADYETVVRRLDHPEEQTPAHSVFYRGSVTTHHRPSYFFAIRNSSVRDGRGEVCNGENPTGYFMADGATHIAVRGDEYFNIFPLWQWDRIPGVTAPAMKEVPENDFGKPGYGTFVGGVTDGVYGVTALDYFDPTPHVETYAQKAWFCFDEEIVCLGTGIYNGKQTYTTVEQNWGEEHFTLHDRTNNKLSTMEKEVKELPCPQADWILHKNIGYVFPEKCQLYLSNQHKSGNWNTIGSSDLAAEGRVFSLVIDHGKPSKAAPASYCYYLLPGKDEDGMQRYMEQQPIEVLANTAAQQVVHHRTLDIYGFVFHEAGTFEAAGIQIKVDKPCLVMIKDLNKDEMTVCLSDPCQKESVIQVELTVPSFASQPQHLTYRFDPASNYAGETQTQQIKKANL